VHLCSWKAELSSPFTYLWQCPTRIHINPTPPFGKQLHFQLLFSQTVAGQVQKI